MAYEQRETGEMTHALTLTGRERLVISGVENVKGFDEETVLLHTCQGDLIVRGEQLHVERIDLEQGRLEVQGHVRELCYQTDSGAQSLWTRLFG